MNTLSSYSYKDLKSTVSADGVRLLIGPFGVSIKSDIDSVSQHLNRLYSDYTLLDEEAFIDFHVLVNRQTGLRRWIKPQTNFSLDDYQPFTPLPLAQAPAQLEWGLNWCIASFSHQYLIVHSAVIEKNGVSIIMPGHPGSGKSTLCAALLFEGWRLLSDEMALISLNDLSIQPMPRPVGLKNQSIDIIRDTHPDALLGPVIKGTTKGDISHLMPPIPSLEQQEIKVALKYLVFPRFDKNAKTEIKEKSEADACMTLIDNAFNFNILGTEGFHAASNIVEKTDCFEITYPNLEQAINSIDRITCN